MALNILLPFCTVYVNLNADNYKIKISTNHENVEDALCPAEFSLDLILYIKRTNSSTSLVCKFAFIFGK